MIDEKETQKNKSIDSIEELKVLVEQGLFVVGSTEDVLDGPDGIYLSPDFTDEHSETHIRELEEIPGFMLGSSDSHNEIRFARVAYSDSDEQEQKSLSVAIKSGDGATEDFAFEMASLLEVRRRGLDALLPLAIVKGGNDSFLVTRFRPDVKGLDNQNWAVRPGEAGYEKVEESLRFIALSLALMHGNGIFHGDAQPKNFLRSDIGKPVICDLEIGCNIAGTNEEHQNLFNDLNDNKGTALNDLKILWMTINRPIGKNPDNILLGRDAEPQEIYDAFMDNFVKNYIESLKSTAPPEVLAGLNIDEVIGQIDALMCRDLGLQQETRT